MIRSGLRRRLYVDTSAYLAMLLKQPGFESVSTVVADATPFSSVLLILEARRNVIRLAREGTLTKAKYEAALERIEEDAAIFVLRDLTIDLCDALPMPPVVTPRSLDLAHLRTALWFHAAEPIERFVTVDRVQRAAAKELGLPV